MKTAVVWIKDGFFYFDVTLPQLHLRSKMSDRAKRLVSVKEYDASCGYLVADVEYEGIGIEEEYFDIKDSLDTMGLDSNEIFSAVDSVVIGGN